MFPPTFRRRPIGPQSHSSLSSPEAPTLVGAHAGARRTMELTGKAALLTGGRRMGVALASKLAAAGADVALSYRRSQEEADRAAAVVREKGRKGIVLEADLASSPAAKALVNQAAAALGRLDIVVHLASTYRHTPFDELTEDDWSTALNIDLTAAFRLARAAAPHLRATGGGRIVTVSDWTAASGRPRYTGYLPYYVAKCAVIALTEGLALELAPDHILVNAVAPGPILPPEELDADALSAVESATPLGRWGGADALANVVLDLVRSDFVTGETVRVDGGRHVR